MRYLLALGLLIALFGCSKSPTKPKALPTTWLGTYRGWLYSTYQGQAFTDSISVTIGSSVAFRLGDLDLPTVTDSLAYPTVRFRAIATPDTLYFQGHEVLAGRIDGSMRNQDSTLTGSWTATK